MEDISVRMHKDSLADIPVAPLPDGFSFRYYKTGDDEAWVSLYDAAEEIVDISLDVFQKQFYGNVEALSKRMIFICNANADLIATSTAWYDDIDKDERLGRVHWVAMHPDYQGRGLAKPLLTKTLEAMRDCGHISSYLMTSTSRIPALTLYMRYGFVPTIRHADDRKAWQLTLPALREDMQRIVQDQLDKAQ